MQCVLWFASAVVLARGTASHGSESAVAPSHPILNVHMTDANDAVMMNGLAERRMDSEELLGALETRGQASANALENFMFTFNGQIHELVNIGSSMAAARVTGGVMQQLRGRSRSDGDGRHEIRVLKQQLDDATRDARAQDESAESVDAGDGFDTGAEAVAREKLMNAQKNFAIVDDMVETDDQKAIDSKLASAMESPSHVGAPVPVHLGHDIVHPCQLDARTCPHGWSHAGAACVASSDYRGPCASELTLSGMNEEQLRAIAKYCSLDISCQ